VSVPQKDAVEAWKSIAVGERREVLALARKGLRHPVPDTAAAAYAWSHRASLDQGWNKAPGWLLPSLGLLLAGVGLVLTLVVFLVGGVLVVVCGLAGWNTLSCSRLLRRVYSSPLPGLPEAHPIE